MRLNIINIAITGFRGYKDEVVYSFKDRTFIKGDNGLGKSSIGEAITWCLTGCDMWGNEKATTKLVNDSKPKVTSVVMECYLDGETMTITRRKKGSSQDVFIDDKKSNTNELSNLIFKSKDLFLSIFNPYYFPELTPKAAKELLSSVLVPIKRDEIFKELGDYLTNVLKENRFVVPETFMADVRADLKEQQENLIFLDGVATGAKKIEVPEKKQFDDTELNNLKEQLKALNNTANGMNEELAALEQPKTYSEELADLRVQESLIRSSLNNISLQELIPLGTKKREKDDLLNKYHMKKAQLESMDKKIVKCDKCGNEIDLTKEARELLQAEIKNIIAEGKKLGEEIVKIEAENADIEKNNTKIKHDKETEANEKLAEIQIKHDKYVKLAADAYTEYEAKRKAIADKYAAADKEKANKVQELESKISELQEQQREVLSFNDNVDRLIKQNEQYEKDIIKNKEQVANSQNKIKQLNLAIDAAKQYNSIKLKKQSEQIDQYLDRVSIRFEKLTKDGEIKDDFKVLLDGKEFNKLSGSEKIRAGLEIGNLLMNVQDMFVPIFVDDGERINNIPQLKTQMIVTKVTTDKEIVVEDGDNSGN